MYARRYGLIRTLAPLHVGASEGEESGNLNLIFNCCNAANLLSSFP